ncbi:hypothetical protein BWP20_22640, partial [Mycobacterium tuberculosis]
DAPAAGVPGLPGMPASGAGRAGVVPRYGVRLTVMTRPLSGGFNSENQRSGFGN